MMENRLEPAANAGAWTRFFARHIDFTFEYAVVFFLANGIYILGWWLLDEDILELIDAFFWPLFVLFVPSLVMIFDFCIYHIFGNTFGKMVYNLEVIDSETGLTLKSTRYLLRNFMVLLFGFGTGWVQIITTLAQLIQYRNLKRKGSTGYDKSMRTAVICSHFSSLRMFGGIVVYGMIIGIFLGGLYFLADYYGVSLREMLH